MSKGVECLICGVEERDHHEFTPPPKGCVCAPTGWHGADMVPDVCGKFMASRFDLMRCETCEHDKDCHAPAEEQP